MNQNTLKVVPHDRFTALSPEDLTALEAESVVGLALEVLAARYRPGEPLSSPAEVRGYLQLKLCERSREVFAVVFLDSRHRVLAIEELFYGSIDGAQVSPRIIVQRALVLNSAAVILCHNHPSGVAEPSRADELLTQQLIQALKLVEVRVLDHIVVGPAEAMSFAERGLL